MMRESSGTVGGAPALDQDTLVLVAELNEELFELLSRLAARQPGPGEGLLGALGAAWATLDPPARQRLAHSPYLLLDAGFADAQRWAPLLTGGVADPGAAAEHGYLREEGGAALIRRVLLLAWHLARTHRLAGRFVLGMTGECAERIAALRLQQLEALGALHPEWIRLRFDTQPHFWGELLRATQTNRTATLRQLQLHGLQILAGELIGAHCPGHGLLRLM